MSGAWRSPREGAGEQHDASDRHGDALGQHERPAPLNPYSLGTWRRAADHDASGHSVDQTGLAGTADPSAAPPDPEDPLVIPHDPDASVRDFSRPDEYARRALNHAKAAAKRMGYTPRSRVGRGRFDLRDTTGVKGGYSGARPDARDPQGFSSVLTRVLGDLGWEDGMSQGQVLADWESIVGDTIAQHCTVVSFENGLLVLAADSSAWAAQLRMLTPQLITRIHESVGRAVVSELKVTGPQGASWKKGRRTVNWRGPRDTYG